MMDNITGSFSTCSSRTRRALGAAVVVILREGDVDRFSTSVISAQPTPCRTWLLAQLGHLHGDEHLRAAARVRAAQWGHVAVVSTLADPDVAVCQPSAQGGVVGHPAAAPPLHPGVALAGDGLVGLAGPRMQIAGHVAGR